MRIDMNQFHAACKCGRTHSIEVEEIIIESGAIKHLQEILDNYHFPVIVCDENTYAATKEEMKTYYDSIHIMLLSGDNIHADDIQVEYIENRWKEETDLLIAVGSGTIHDLTRFVSYKHRIPFVSIPTAASVDGFVSTVAAMTWKGMKKTMPAQAPSYVFADTNIFGRAPFRLTASGISDLMGKYTALLDWKVCHYITGEYFCETIYNLEFEAVREVESVLNAIKDGDKESLEKLMYALLLSGLAMQMIGNSRPASGSEHHMSHLWEMNIINEPIDALHGEKVSVGLLLVLKYYERLKRSILEGKIHITENDEYEEDLLRETFGKRGLYEAVLEENDPNPLKEVRAETLQKVMNLVVEELEKLPDTEKMRNCLKEAGCKTTLSEIGLSEEVEMLSLRLCPYVRRRLTLLRIAKKIESE